MSGQHVANAGDAVVCTAPHGKSLEDEGGPGAIPQQVFERVTLDTQMGTKECDPDSGVDRESAVLLPQHVGGGSGVEQARATELADHPAADPLGDGGQMELDLENSGLPDGYVR